MKKCNTLLKNKILCILILWIMGILLWRLLNTYEAIVGDAKDYWNRGNELWQNGHFSVLNIRDGFRGYVYPVYLGLVSRINIWEEKSGFVIVNSLLISIWFVYVVPKLHNCEMTSRMDGVRCILHFTLFNILFYGLSIYPLTDLMAIMLCGLSVLLEKELERSKGIKSFALSILLGIMIYCTYNVRTIYIFSGIWLTIRLIYFLITTKWIKVFRKIGLFCGNMVGIGIAALPQTYMNYFQLGKISLQVPTNGLMRSQILWGIQWQRYETFIGNNEWHPKPEMHFLDPVGNMLLERAGIDGASSWREIIGFIFDYPFDVAGIYVRHIVNAMLPCWPNSYVMNMDNNKIFYVILSYTILFVFGTILLNKLCNRQYLFNYIALLLPVLFISPGGVEARFFAAVYILMIGTLCYNLNLNAFGRYIKENKVKLLIMFFLLGGLLTAMWGNMLASEGVYPVSF